MNNKLIKRIAAVVLGVAVLSTCAFASEFTNTQYYDSSKTLTFTVTPSDGDASFIAYATEGDTVATGDPIVAVDQFTGAKTDTISILESKLQGKSKIVVMSGDEAGVLDTEVLTIADCVADVEVTKNYTEEFSAKDLGIGTDEEKFTKAYVFSIKLTSHKGDAYTYGIKSITGKAGEGEPINLIAKSTVYNGSTAGEAGDLAALTFTGNGNYKIDNFILIGAPEGVEINAEASATPVVATP